MNNGVLVLDAGRNVVRFLPPLVIEKEQIDKVVEVLDSALEKENK
jgi:acetylornithine/N-succinyldiaminopimelate aminotransferase